MVEGISTDESRWEEFRCYPYLVRLRDSGVTNMWGGAEYLAEAFGLPQREASKILVRWIGTFDLPEDEQPDDGRNSRMA
jgi:hypothetical protein